MESYKQPRSLFDISANIIGNHIGNITLDSFKKCQTISESETFTERCDFQRFLKKTTELYDVNMPNAFHDIVTYYSLRHIASFLKDRLSEYDNCECSIFTELDIAVRSNITKLIFLDWPHEIRLGLCKSLSRLRNLKYLHFVSKDFDDLKYIISGVTGMKNLEWFRFWDCNDKILEVVCENCPLKYLDIRTSRSVTDSSVLSLLKLQNLRELNFFGTRISEESCERVLVAIPSLRKVKYPRMRVVIENLSKRGIKLPLEYVHYNCFSVEHVENLVNVCPFLIYLSVRDISYNRNVALSGLSVLKHLTTLRFIGSDMNNIMPVLKSRGHKITKLKLFSIDSFSFEACANISLFCPYLQTFYLDSILGSDFDDIRTSCYVPLPINIECNFQNLEVLEYASIINRNASPLIFILSTCQNIRIIRFQYILNLFDDHISKILSLNPFVKLEEFIVEENCLTINFVYKLLDSCKNLRQIGIMKYWINVTEEEIKQLHRYVTAKNLNVHVIETVDDIPRKNTL